MIADGRGAALAIAGGAPVILDRSSAIHEIARIEREFGPRWVWWSKETARPLIEAGVRPAKCWDLSSIHRILFGGWRSGPGHVWAALHDLDIVDIPATVAVDLFSPVDETPDVPIGADGHLRPEWTDGAWAASAERMMRWAELAVDLRDRQVSRLQAVTERPYAARAALSESAAEMLCAELEVDGLPFDRQTGEKIISGFIGPRPSSADEAHAESERRDHEVLQHLPPGPTYDLRSNDQVKSMLRRVGIEVPDTRAWRLERLVGAHPVVAPLLEWRRAERVLTTFGYAWIDEHLGADGRLRGAWSGSDGAAGRMTATAGLHNMPAELRPAVIAEHGHLFVRADLGQIEPRILAAVSGDPVLAAATNADDMYAPVAERLHVDRDIAKVAVLGAMYGQTTGKGAEALAGLEREYPVAMRYLRDADEAAQVGTDLRTYGGRLVTMRREPETTESRSRAAARGRYGRNAMVQGAAAEFFKTWVVLIRARAALLDTQIVLCLHDEVLVHAPEADAAIVAGIVDECLQEAAHRWAPRERAGRPTGQIRQRHDHHQPLVRRQVGRPEVSRPKDSAAGREVRRRRQIERRELA